MLRDRPSERFDLAQQPVAGQSDVVDQHRLPARPGSEVRKFDLDRPVSTPFLAQTKVGSQLQALVLAMEAEATGFLYGAVSHSVFTWPSSGTEALQPSSRPIFTRSASVALASPWTMKVLAHPPVRPN